MAKPQTVFFGSGPVALQNALAIQNAFSFEAIITKPTTEAAMRHAFPGTPVFSVSKKAELDELLRDRSFTSSFGILIDFGIIVSQEVIDAFPKGIINSHFSLLPEWRGADPITFSILSGQRETGVSLMLLSAGMDEGLLLAQAPYAINDDDTTTTLTSNLIEISAALLTNIVPEYLAANIAPHRQEHSAFASEHKISYSRKLTKEDGQIDWHKPATDLEREVRAFIEWPHSYTTLGGKEVIIMHATVVAEEGAPGKIEFHKNQLIVYCGSDALEIQRLKPAGKKEMSAAAFIAGYGRFLSN